MHIDDIGKPKKRKVGLALINLAISENNDSLEYVTLLEEIKMYFSFSKPIDRGENRNNVVHGYMHPRFWDKESAKRKFEKLEHCGEK